MEPDAEPPAHRDGNVAALVTVPFALLAWLTFGLAWAGAIVILGLAFYLYIRCQR